jgi:hypothetical protein
MCELRYLSRSESCRFPARCQHCRYRCYPVGRVVVAGCVINERALPVRRVVVPGRVGLECKTTRDRVTVAGCKAEKRIITLSSVVAGVASVRWRVNRSRRWRNRKQAEH